ncbi:MAG: phytanoyl-CoA dioxygenase family protein [Gammaproteobacteria bacterium]|nr:phytanoyl-CoA dioxygenase family protein [Gammaproteobacteria bacterium]
MKPRSVPENYWIDYSCFGERAFLKKNPDIASLLMTRGMNQLLESLGIKNKQLTKAIYFDKPPQSNWSVPWHQDLMINVVTKVDAPDFQHWRTKTDNTTVQPPTAVLENTTTIRIHLDDCDADNGALRCISGSHKKGIIPMKDWHYVNNETICEVAAGGVLLMKSLTLHASHRTENSKQRRVLHLELNEHDLPNGISWHEKMYLGQATST